MTGIKGTVVDVEYHLIKMRSLWVMRDDGTTIQLRLSHKANRDLPPDIYGAEVQGEAYEYRPGQYSAEWLAISTPKVDSLLSPDRCICIIDSNEASQSPELVADIRGFNIDVAVSSLVGTGADLVPSSRLGIQRKTIDDLAGSIQSGRLFSEMDELISSYEIPVLLIEGTEPIRSHMQAPSLEGVLAYLCRTIPEIRIINRPNRYSCALFIKSLVFGEQTDRHHMPSLKQWKQREDLQQAKDMLIQQIPSVGPRTSKRLLRKRGNVENIITMPREDWLSFVPKTKINTVDEVLHGKYKE